MSRKVSPRVLRAIREEEEQEKTQLPPLQKRTTKRKPLSAGSIIAICLVVYIGGCLLFSSGNDTANRIFHRAEEEPLFLTHREYRIFCEQCGPPLIIIDGRKWILGPLDADIGGWDLCYREGKICAARSGEITTHFALVDLYYDNSIRLLAGKRDIPVVKH